MPMILELPDALAASLLEEANRRGMAMHDFAMNLLTRPKIAAQRHTDGASLVAYLEAEGLLGTRTDTLDSQAESCLLRTN